VCPGPGGAGADRAPRAGRGPVAPPADGPDDHAEADAAGALHQPGEPAGSLLLRPPRGESTPRGPREGRPRVFIGALVFYTQQLESII